MFGQGRDLTNMSGIPPVPLFWKIIPHHMAGNTKHEFKERIKQYGIYQSSGIIYYSYNEESLALMLMMEGDEVNISIIPYAYNTKKRNNDVDFRNESLYT
jgi:hypothetical protein